MPYKNKIESSENEKLIINDFQLVEPSTVNFQQNRCKNKSITIPSSLSSYMNPETAISPNTTNILFSKSINEKIFDELLIVTQKKDVELFLRKDLNNVLFNLRFLIFFFALSFYNCQLTPYPLA